uniref:N-(5'-phosphoribosyl)anthranilate isomerase n=1 Tax=Candidatus Kentrum sp. UNK TaxID=2126344 RepID=A0A451AE81_9GAMM|nr:MAG: phosphoribosylanthranilate isomerase [Candidatus Kentron sp. UNK]VFK73464.1 MAG: phosphoribosylanthranilate isomerase [Candidatus Kentron sp. UNK]
MKHTWDRKKAYTRVKLCEFESLEAAYEASFINADLLGFHLFSDQDYFNRAYHFKEIFGYLPPTVIKTLLTDLEQDILLQVLDIINVGAIQLYNHSTREQIQQLRDKTHGQIKIIKVMSEKSEENKYSDNDFIAYYDEYVDAFLLDSFWEGGTGITGDWEHCAEITRRCSSPVFLAGGLTADNVASAIEKVKPFGVDVENGVSTRVPDGRRLKNMLKCRLFVEKVKEADWRLERSVS